MADQTHDVYRTVIERLLQIEAPGQAAPEVDSTVEAFGYVLSELGDDRGAVTKALTALAIAELDDDAIDRIYRIVHQARGRRTKYRLKEKIDRYQRLVNLYNTRKENVEKAYVLLQPAFLDLAQNQ